MGRWEMGNGTRPKTTSSPKNHKDGKNHKLAQKPQRRQKPQVRQKPQARQKPHHRAFAVLWSVRGRNSSRLVRSALRARDAHFAWLDAPEHSFWRLFPFLTRSALRAIQKTQARPKTTSSPKNHKADKNHKLAQKPQRRQKTTSCRFCGFWSWRGRNSSHLTRSALRARDAHSPLIYATSRGFSRF